jgi:hypothetical protein
VLELSLVTNHQQQDEQQQQQCAVHVTNCYNSCTDQDFVLIIYEYDRTAIPWISFRLWGIPYTTHDFDTGAVHHMFTALYAVYIVNIMGNPQVLLAVPVPIPVSYPYLRGRYGFACRSVFSYLGYTHTCTRGRYLRVCNYLRQLILIILLMVIYNII